MIAKVRAVVIVSLFIGLTFFASIGVAESLSVSIDQTDIDLGEPISATITVADDSIEILQAQWWITNEGEGGSSGTYCEIPAGNPAIVEFQPYLAGQCRLEVTYLNSDGNIYTAKSPEVTVHGAILETSLSGVEDGSIHAGDTISVSYSVLGGRSDQVVEVWWTITNVNATSGIELGRTTLTAQSGTISYTTNDYTEYVQYNIRVVADGRLTFAAEQRSFPVVDGDPITDNTSLRVIVDPSEIELGETVSATINKENDGISILQALWWIRNEGEGSSSETSCKIPEGNHVTIEFTPYLKGTCWLEVTYQDISGNIYIAKSNETRINGAVLETHVSGVYNGLILSGSTITVDYLVTGGSDSQIIESWWTVITDSSTGGVEIGRSTTTDRSGTLSFQTDDHTNYVQYNIRVVANGNLTFASEMKSFRVEHHIDNFSQIYDYSGSEEQLPQWDIASDDFLEFIIKRINDDESTFTHFVGVMIDDQYVAPENYTALPGSLILRLKTSYLETLASGGHMLKAIFDDGAIEIPFSISSAEVSVTPTITPVVTTTVAPELTTTPTAMPEPTEEPTVTPIATLEPMAEPTPTPEATSNPTEKPTAMPTAEAISTPEIANYYLSSGTGQRYQLFSGQAISFTVKRGNNDEKTFSLFSTAFVDGRELKREEEYEIGSGSLIITMNPAFLDTLNVGNHVLKAVFIDGSIEVPFTVSGKIDSTKFDDVAILNDTFTFKKIWQGDHEDSIDFTLYKADGSIYHHGFDKRVISKTEWRYNAYFSAPAACYVIEKPVPGYQIKYVNVGVYADVTDRCCDGGTIINKKVPKTGDAANFALWAGIIALGVIGLTTTVIQTKRKKEHK